MQCSSMTSASVPASRFLSELLSWLPFMVDIYLQFERNVCFSEVIFGQYSITARRKKAKTPDKTAGHQSSLVRQFSQLVSCSVTECGSLKTKSRQNSQFQSVLTKDRATGNNTHAYRHRNTYRHKHNMHAYTQPTSTNAETYILRAVYISRSQAEVQLVLHMWSPDGKDKHMAVLQPRNQNVSAVPVSCRTPK